MSEEQPRRSRRLASRGEDPAPSSNAPYSEGGLPVPPHPWEQPPRIPLETDLY
jgi:hypothetical protein